MAQLGRGQLTVTTRDTSSRRASHAFTIVELLIVIVVIAILAAITIVAYNGIQDRARASAASAALSGALKKIKVAQVTADSTVALTCAEFSSAVGATTTTCTPEVGDTKYQYTPDLAGTYCITATVGNKSYYVTGTNSTPAVNGCAGHGVGGVAAVTNYFRDPDAAGSTSNFLFSGSPATHTRSIASDRSHNGSTSLKTVATGSGQLGTAALLATNSLLLTAGQQMSWSFWIYSTKAGNIIPYSDARRASDSAYAGCSSTVVSVPANAWTKVTGTCSFPSDTYPTQTGGYNLPVVSADTIWTDEFMLSVSASPLNYADGNSSNWVWNGSANNATSTGPPF